MKLRSLASPIAALLTAAAALAAPACGKDKPAEEAAAVAPAEGDKAATDNAAGADKDKAEGDKSEKSEKVEGEGKPEHERAGTEDAKSRLRAARERVNARRPQPMRHGVDGLPKGEGEVALGEPGANPGAVPTPSEPGAVAPVPGGPTPVVPTPGPPAVAAPGTPAVPAPGTPAVPEPTAPPVAEGIPGEAGGPGIEIRTEAGIIDAADKLPLALVAEITGRTLAAGVPLQGIAIVPGYGSVFYAASDAAKFGVALQVWQDPTRRESDDRFRRMRLQYPNAQDVTALQPAKAFYSYFETIQSLTWVDPTKRIVVTVTCGESICNQDQLARMAKKVRERI